MAGPVATTSEKDKRAGKVEGRTPKLGRRSTSFGPDKDILDLQNKAGNQAVSRLLQPGIYPNPGRSTGSLTMQILTDMMMGAVPNLGSHQINVAEIERARKHPEGHVQAIPSAGSPIDAAEIEWARKYPEGYVQQGFFLEEGNLKEDHNILSIWNFDVGSAESTKFETALRDKLRMINNWVDLGDTLQITGHASVSGSEETNWTLSQKRALNIKNWLVNKGGLDETSITVVAAGTSLPIPSHRVFDPKQRAMNRRVEIRRIKRLWSPNDYDRALNIVHNQLSEEPQRKKRLLGVISLLKNQSGDDRYIDQNGIGEVYYCYTYPGYEWLDYIEEWDKNSPKIIHKARNYINGLHPGYSDHEILSTLLALDTRIWEGIRWINEQAKKPEGIGVPVPVLIFKAQVWISARQSDANSIYFYYGKGQ